MEKNITICTEENVFNGLLVRVDIPVVERPVFAQLILHLVNHKSTLQHISGLLDIKTYTESNIIDLTFTLGDEDRTEEEILAYVKNIVSQYVLNDDDATVKKLSDIETVTIFTDILEDAGIVKSCFSTFVFGQDN